MIVNHKNILLTIAIILLCVFSAFAQGEIDPNGYNKFYYKSGKVSGEGTMRNGKPDGYWITYHPNGVIKSEGNRKNYLLDSTWTFYTESGAVSKRIEYRADEKTGYYETYKEVDSAKSILISKELYLNDKRQGISYYYYPNGKIKETINYKDGIKDGYNKIYSEDGRIITLFDYYKGFLLRREKINRNNRAGQKKGLWLEFYDNDIVKVEANYTRDTLDGYYREYDITGKLLVENYYKMGEELSQSEISQDVIDYREEFYENGKVKKSGSFRDDLPVGVHREFDKKGTIVKSMIFDDNGKLVGKGIVDLEGKEQGEWEHFYPSGAVRSRGKYKNGKREGEWQFYFITGATEQEGKYVKGKPDGLWKWYYPDGNLWREENFYKGKHEGLSSEFDENGKVIEKGEYYDGEKEGEWFYHVNDHTEKGAYKSGYKEGMWYHYFPDGTVKYKGIYVNGEPDGKHVTYHENGKIKWIGNYVMGKKEGRWKRYNKEGLVEIIYTYQYGQEVKINGRKIDVEEDLE